MINGKVGFRLAIERTSPRMMPMTLTIHNPFIREDSESMESCTVEISDDGYFYFVVWGECN